MQLTRQSIIGRIVLIFGLLIVVIIASAIFSMVQYNRQISNRIDESLDNTLEMANAILYNETGRLTFISEIIREKNTSFYEFLEWDKVRPLQVELQNISSVHQIDRLFLFDEDGEILATSHTEVGIPEPELYKSLIAVPAERVGIEEVDEAVLQAPHVGESVVSTGNTVLCYKSVIHLINYIGDIYGYIVVINVIDNKKVLAEKIVNVTSAEVIVYNRNKEAVLSSLSGKPTPYPSKGLLTFKDSSYYSRLKKLANFQGKVVGHLAVAVDNTSFIRQRNQRLLINLLPFLGTVAISIALLILLKFRVFDKIKRLAYILLKVTEGEGNLGMRLETASEPGDMEGLDEVETITINFNQMMDKLEATYGQLSETNEILNRLIEDSPFGIMMIDHDKKIARINNAGCKIFGRQKEEIENKVCHEFVCPRKQGECPIWDKGESIKQLETIALCRENRETPILKSAVKIEDFILEAFIDITDIQTARRETEKAKEAAEEASQVKSDFLANMSHEIRTPMNAIIGLTDFLISQDLSTKALRNLRIIKDSADTLLGIINDILDFSKIEAGMLDMEKVDFRLHEVLNLVVDLFSKKCSEKGLELLLIVEDDVPDGLIGDPLRLKQIIINLISNAIRFTEQGEIVIRVKCQEKFNNTILLAFEVKDTGIGIDQDLIDKLFTAFTQADGSHTRRYGGTGLGLAICKRLVEMMAGEIKVESEPDKGSTFHFTAKFDRQEDELQIDYKTPEDLKGLKILIVDDNEMVRQVLSEVMICFSFLPETAASGEEALAKLRQQANTQEPFQLVMLDWVLGGIDGIATARKIKENPLLKGLPVIIISGFRDEKEIPASEVTIIDGFLSKPIKNSLLFNTIMGIFGKEKAKIAEHVYETIEEPDLVSKISGSVALLVEDNLINQQVAKEILESAGLGVIMVNNGKEAVQLIAESKTKFDVVLMDIQMPMMDGYEATQRIRQDPRFQELPIIAMTAHAMKGDREKSLAAGMNDHINKPIRSKELFTTLAHWIQPGKRDLPPELILSPERHALDEALPGSLAGLDIEAGLSRVNQKRGLYKKLLLEFHRDYELAEETMQEMLKHGDLDSAIQLVHSIKGVSANIAAYKLETEAQDLENSLLQGDCDDSSGLVSNFEKALNQVLTAIQSELMVAPPKIEKHVKTELSVPADVEPILHELHGLICRDDPAAEEYLESTREILAKIGIEDELSMLVEQVNRFDFPVARKTLEAIVEKQGISLERDHG